MLLDIETAPNLAYIWGMYEQNAIDFKSQGYIMCFSAKWLGGEHITKGLPDYQGYKKGSENDRKLIQELWNLLNEAEIVIAQNGDAFDIKKINTRFTSYGMSPPSPYRTLDTKKIAKRYFYFNSNSLDNMGEFLGLGRKIKHEGFELWKRCIAGDLKAWNKMKAYNKQDVVLLEKIYLHFLPWIKNHPNLAAYVSGLTCPRCKGNLAKRGLQVNNSTTYHRMYCRNCKGWSRGVVNLQKVKQYISI